MWSESSSLSTVNLEKKFTTVPDISNFSYWLLFYGAPCRLLLHVVTVYILSFHCQVASVLTFFKANDDDADKFPLGIHHL